MTQFSRSTILSVLPFPSLWFRSTKEGWRDAETWKHLRLERLLGIIGKIANIIFDTDQRHLFKLLFLFHQNQYIILTTSHWKRVRAQQTSIHFSEALISVQCHGFLNLPQTSWRPPPHSTNACGSRGSVSSSWCSPIRFRLFSFFGPIGSLVKQFDNLSKYY